MMMSLNNQKGLSLIEFMIAGVIGLILTLGLFQIFVSNRQAFDVTGASSYVQETGRMATEILSKASRNADFWGCASRDSVTNKLDTSAGSFTVDVLGFEKGVEGEDNNSDGADAILDGTDTLTLRGARGSAGIQIESTMANAGDNLAVTSTAGLEEDDLILISSCRGGDIVQIDGVSGTGTIDPDGTLSNLYEAGTSVLRPFSETYFVGSGASGEPALFLRRGSMGGSTFGGTQTIELVEGVEDMQVLYGEDTDSDGNANSYRVASAVSDWTAVRSVRISLLVRSASDDVFDTAQTLQFNGAAVDGSDLRLRRVYTMTSTIRNRI